jgi:Tfp pilus assembly protein PilO
MSPIRSYIGAGIIAISGILFFVLVLPTYNSVSARRTALADREESLAQQQQELDSFNKLKDEATKRSDQIKQFSAIVPATKSPAEIVSMLEVIAKESGLQLSTLAMGSSTVQEKSPYASQAIDLGLSGSYTSFRTFVGGIEKNLRIMDIDAIDASPTTDNSPIINFRIRAHAYYLQ